MRTPLAVIVAAMVCFFVGHVDAPPVGEVQKLVDLRLDLDDVALKI